MLHTFTCCCIYTFVIKNEAGPIVARLFNLFQNGTNEIDLELFRTGLPAEMWYLDKKFTLGVFMVVIIMPLSLLRSVKHLGWTSMIAIISIVFFVATVISRQPDAAASCPIHYEGIFSLRKNSTNGTCHLEPHKTEIEEVNGVQVCETTAFNWTSQVK